MSQCVACEQELEVEVELTSEDEDAHMEGSSTVEAASNKQRIPDDVQLKCGDHFHWQCLLDAYQVETCPNCAQQLVEVNASTSEQRLLVNLHNEGGYQQDLDILPLLREEQYLKAYPEERKARAFLEFCREGDLQAIIGMIQDSGESHEEAEDEDDEDSEEEVVQKPMSEILVYQDQVGNMQSALHCAVISGSREVAWLLLLLASDLDMMEFPVEVFQEAEQLGIMRDDRIGAADIRDLVDADSRSAEDLARQMGGVWAADGWVGSGRLSKRRA